MNFKFLKKLDLNKLLLMAGGFGLILIVIFIVWWNKEIVINNAVSTGNKDDAPKSLVTGLDCLDANTRPIAIMLASDPEARPLSGISQADMVFEMPVDPTGITRFMAVFQCEKPEEIGSVRSARNDFIPLVAGMKIIYVHWGGEQDALEKLDNN